MFIVNLGGISLLRQWYAYPKGYRSLDSVAGRCEMARGRHTMRIRGARKQQKRQKRAGSAGRCSRAWLAVRQLPQREATALAGGEHRAIVTPRSE